MNARRLILATLTTLCAALAVPAFSAAPAFAAFTHEYETSITQTESLAPFGEPWGLALDSTGNLYVADATGQAIDIFNPLSVFQPPQLDDASVGANPFTGPYVRSVAVDNLPGPNQGTVYVAEANHENVDVFKPEGAGKYKFVQERKFGGYMYVAFDNSIGPNSGDLYLWHGFSPGSVELVPLKADGTLPGPGEAPEPKPLEAPPGGVTHGAQYATGLAVGPAGNVYLANPAAKAVDVYTAEGTAPTVLTEGPPGTGSFEPIDVGVDPSNGDVYAVDAANHAVDEFSSAGKYLGQITEAEPEPGKPTAFVNPLGVAVNAMGDVYVSDGAAKAVDVFGPDIVVPDVTTGLPTEVKGTSATLNGTVDPDGVAVTNCHFDYGATTAYGQTAACAETVGSGTSEVAVHADIAGLTTGTTYHFRLQASNTNGTNHGSDATLSTPPAPSITGATATNVTATSVDLNAQVNPNGRETTYHFEYGTSTAYGTSVPVPEVGIGKGSVEVPVTQHVEGLSPNVTYHWRVVATNEAGTTTGVDHTFIYPETGGGLPDNRAYEMVTPVHKNGALIADSFAATSPDISEDGSRIILSSVQCFANAGSCIAIRGGGSGSNYLFSRAAGGWVATSLSPPAAQFETNTKMFASADADTALYSMPTQPFGEDDFYARQTDGLFQDIGPVSPPSGGPDFEAVLTTESRRATADLSHVVYVGQPIWPVSKNPFAEERALFEYTGTGNSEPELVGVSGGPSSTELISACETTLGGSSQNNALSADGRTVYFTAQSNKGLGSCPSGTGSNEGVAVPVPELYARIDNGEPGAHTVAISEPEAPETLSSTPADENCALAECQRDIAEEANWRGAQFEGASGDGSKAFFLDTQRLTDDATEGGGRASECHERGFDCNLYLYDFDSPGGHNLIDVSAGDTSGGGPRVQGVMAVSTDGSHVYFVAKGVLTGVANGEGQVAQQEQDNLYVFERECAGGEATCASPEERTSFVAALPASEESQWEIARSANVTPDGRFFVFTSGAALTPDDTRTDGAQQVFRYDAQTGQLVRMSIGEHGFNDNGNGGAGNASIVQAFKGYNRNGVGRADPTMSNDGAYVFFDSPVALTSGALSSVPIGTEANSTRVAYAQNVYEYHEGNVYLISDGRDTSTAPAEVCLPNISAVCLLGSDATGKNVFFTTADQLVPADTDTEMDVYDARICEPESGNPCIQQPPPPLPPCLGEACHGTPPATPSLLTPGSASFNGAGNLTPIAPALKTTKRTVRCRRDEKLSHGRCVKAKTKKKAKARKASNDRRAES